MMGEPGPATTSEPMDKSPPVAAVKSGKAKKASVPEKAAEARDLMDEGAKLQVKGDLVGATECFSRALEAMVEEYGELGEECGEAYYVYGNALFETAKFDKNNIFAGGAGGPQAAEEGGAEGGDPEEVSPMDLAFELLEVSRVLLSKRSDRRSRLLHAQALYDIGEFLNDCNQFEDAAEEFTKVIKIRKELFPPTKRHIAEGYYALGLAQHHGKHFDEAIAAFNEAIKIFEAKIDEAQKKNDAATVQDFQEIVYDLKAKIDDSKEEQAAVRKAAMATRVAVDSAFPGAGADGASAASTGFDAPKLAGKDGPNEIQTMVRKKKKKAVTTLQPKSKKTKLEASSIPASS